MVSFLTVLIFVASVSPSFAIVQAVETFVDSSWTNVIYYIASLSGYDGKMNGYNDDIIINILAVDEYKLYVNGNEYSDANDGDCLTKDTHTVNIGGEDVINIGVMVTNHGLGLGNGLIVDIAAGTDQLGTTTQMRQSMEIPVGAELKDVPIAWWTFDSEAKEDPEQLGLGDDDWYIFDEGWFVDSSKYQFLKRAYKGKFVGNMAEISDIFPPGIEVITGYLHSDVDIDYDEGGGIALRSIEGENLALGKPGDEIKLTDGDLRINGYEYLANVLNDTRMVDLGRIYKVNKMTIFTGKESEQFNKFSLRGYSVEISLDKYRWEEVGIIHDIGKPDKNGVVNIGGFDNYSVDFPPEWARYVRYQITETRIDPPKLGEVMVFGSGFVLEAAYVSPWIDFGSPDTYKNYDMVTWSGRRPDGTYIIVQTQTKSGEDGTPSSWSSPAQTNLTGNVTDSFMFNSPEPATHFRYRVTLKTDDLLKTPVFKKLELKYSLTDQPVSSAAGYVTPNYVAMGADSAFVYTFNYDFNSSASAANQNIKSIAISVPGYSVPNYVYCSDLADTLKVNSGMTYNSTIDTLYVSFDSPITDTDADGAGTINVSFNTSLLRSSHTFEAFLFNSNWNDNAGGIKVWENIAEGSNTVVVSSILKGILNDVKANPKVFTPNNDGKNDFTVIEFTLAKVSTDIMIKIYSPDGSLVYTVPEEKTNSLEPSDYRTDDIGGADEMPGYWNGKDEDDDLVPPGIYIYQVIADTDEGDVFEGGPVVVAY